MKSIAIIPARSGSKGLKDKNIKLLSGKPLIAYSIESALESGLFDEVMVSTDSEQYAQIAREYGAKVPFLRSEKTASDTASTKDCIIEVLEMYCKMGASFDRIMILQPTSPLRRVEDIKQADKIYRDKGAKSVIGVCEVDHSPLWCNVLPENGSLDGFINRGNGNRRQELDKYYRINGAIYLHDTKYYVENDYFYDETAFAYVMERKYSVDIDNEIDFKLAEFMMEYNY